jgi:hypothetical protein
VRSADTELWFQHVSCARTHSDAHSVPNGNTHTNSDADSYSDADTQPDSDAYANWISHANTDANAASVRRNVVRS